MKTESVYEENYKGYLIEIYPDYDVLESPREWDNLGTMACWHRRYTLGDIQPKADMDCFIVELIQEYWKDIELNNTEYIKWAEQQEEDDSSETWLDELDDEKIWKLFSKYYVWLPVFMYEHSGITINTSNSSYPFTCPWDSGMLGLIYIDKKKAGKEFNTIEKVRKCLEAEIQVYDDYLTSNVYGYCVWTLDNDGEKLDVLHNCCGFYPSHEKREQHYQPALDEARYIIDYQVKFDKEQQQLLDTRMMNEKVGK